MEHGANTTHVRWRVLRAREPLTLRVKALVNYRDYHATTRAGDWRMDVARVANGLRVTAFDGARPLLMLAPGADVEAALFFSSRRRHTRLQGDWSSDVCSSD